MTAPPHPAQKKKPNWVLRILLGLFALGLIFVLGIGFIVYRWSQEPDNKRLLGAMKSAMSAGIEAHSAPGAQDLRDAGCKQALVMDPEKLEQLTKQLEAMSDQQKDEREARPRLEHAVVQCQVSESVEMSCETVAQVYGTAVPDAKEPFMVMVIEQSFGRSEARCQGMYERSGRRVADAEAPFEAPPAAPSEP